ncbi:MAG: ABC transporter permease, partial [Rhizobiaceae bacterium]|nr:ABC transporter permease [Rhizobiaceae bacterium]
PDAGKIIATTLDYPAVMDTFGCTPAFLEENPEAAKALATSYYEALDMIAESPEEAYGIMGADVNQSAEQFAGSAQYLEWQDRDAAIAFFGGEFNDFSADAAELLLDAGVIREIPDLSTLADPSFIQE